MRGCLIACVVACLFSFGGCAHVLYAGDVSSQNDGWELHVTQLRDGPNTYTVNHVLYFPENGTKFLWAHIVMKNNAKITRRFDFRSCLLDWGPAHAIPARFVAYSLIMSNYGGNPMQQELDAGEEIDRYIGFAYPVEYLPTLLACGDEVIRMIVKLDYQAGNRAP